jgi:hypothetical protein
MFIFVLRRSALQGLRLRGTPWVAPILAPDLVGGMGGDAHAARVLMSVTGAATTGPVPRRIGLTQETTVPVTVAASSCVQAAAVQYWLAARPYGVLGGAGDLLSRVSSAGTAPDGSACDVVVCFCKKDPVIFCTMAKVPATAAFVIDQSGASTSVMMTANREDARNRSDPTGLLDDVVGAEYGPDLASWIL